MSYQPWRHRSFNVKNQKKELPQVKNLNKLSFNDLLKIKRSYEAYLIKKKEIAAENTEIALINKRIERENEINKQKSENYNKKCEEYEKPFLEFIWAIAKKLEQFRVGSISGLWTETVKYEDFYGDVKFKMSTETINLIEQHKQAVKKHNIVCENKSVNYPNFPQLAIKKKLREPNNYTMLTINGVNFELSYHSIHFEELNNLIGMRRSEIEKQNESARELLRELKARAASKESETRELANTYKRDISKQLSKVDCCPYCAGPLLQNNAHQDHIYPVSKGGQSTRKNLVFVCSSCNQKKSDSMLRTFLKVQGFDAERVHKSLDLLFKDF
jgi:5-methylcytosine-specific restriction endonuclease McrA